MSNINANLIAAAIGAAVAVVGTAGIFLYQKIIEKKQHSVKNKELDIYNISQELEGLFRTISELQGDLESLRAQYTQQKTRKRRAAARKQGVTSSENTYTDNDTEVDAYSTAGTDYADDEFYDCSDSEGAGDVENGIGRSAEPIDEEGLVMAEIDQQTELEMETNCRDNYEKLRALAHSQPYNIEIIWRLARACSFCSRVEENPMEKKKFILIGIEHCEKVIKKTNANLFKWYAILLGKQTEFLPVKEKIQQGYEFQIYVNKALKLRPDDSLLYYLLGRFKYELASLSWFERKVAQTFIAEPPAASYEDAILDFEKCVELSEKPSVDTWVHMAKCYIALGQYTKAIPLLRKASNEVVTAKDDISAQKEANKLLSTYSSYA